MSVTPVPPERYGHVAQMALDRVEGGYAAPTNGLPLSAYEVPGSAGRSALGASPQQSNLRTAPAGSPFSGVGCRA